MEKRKPQTPKNYLEALKALVSSEEEKERLALEVQQKQITIELQEKEIKQAAPKVNYYDNHLQSVNTLTSTQVAKQIGMDAEKLHRKMKEIGILYKQSGQWLLYSPFSTWGLHATRTKTYTRNDGSIGTSVYTVWTTKGLRFIHALNECGWNVKKAIKILNGENYTLTYSILPENAENKNVKFSSSAPNIVSVDNNGKVTALKEGTSTITITTEDSGHTATCEVVSAEISDFMDLRIGSSSIVSINGYITGSVYCYITNTSSKEISLTKFEVKDGSTGSIVLYTDEASKLGSLKSGQSTNLGGQMRYVYLPIFTWTFTYEGKEYQVSEQYKSY